MVRKNATRGRNANQKTTNKLFWTISILIVVNEFLGSKILIAPGKSSCQI